MKAKKGKKQDSIRSDLAHILGYTGTDMDPVGPPSPVGSEKESAAAGRSASAFALLAVQLFAQPVSVCHLFYTDCMCGCLCHATLASGTLAFFLCFLCVAGG